jgi:hypothetical protein
MIERRETSTDADRLQVLAVGELHLAVDGRSLCGLIVHELDAYCDEAGLRAWNCGPLERCTRCSAALVSRIRQPSRAALEGGRS